MDLKAEQQTEEKAGRVEDEIALSIQKNTEKNKRANAVSFV